LYPILSNNETALALHIINGREVMLCYICKILCKYNERNHAPDISLQSNSSEELGEVGGTKAGDGIPTSCGGETIGVTSWVVSSSNIVQCSSASSTIQEGVQEAEWGLSGSNETVIDQGNNTGEDRGSAGSAVDGFGGATADDFDVYSLGGDIREATTGPVEFAGVGGAKLGKEARDGRALVGRLSEDVGESTR